MEVVLIKVALVGFILGTILGSLIKALADRSLEKRTFWGRSYCPHCKKILQWYDLFPIFSYLILAGKCRYCGDRISVEYLLVEVVMGILIGYLFYQSFLNFNYTLDPIPYTLFFLDLLFKTSFISVLTVVFLTDIKKMFIPDRVVIPAIIISIIYLVLITIFKIGYLYYYLSQTVLGRLLLPPLSDYFQRHAMMAAQPFFGSILMGFLIGGFFMALIILTRGRGMGGGDVKLGALLGLGLGFPLALLALVLSFLTGAIFSIILIFLGKKHFGQTIPFGPFLVLGSLTSIFWGQQIIDWYLKLGS